MNHKGIDARNFVRRYSGMILLMVMVASLSLVSGSFLKTSNLINIALQTSIMAVVAIGMTFTIITGGIDLSVGSVAALCGAFASGLIVQNGLPISSAILIALLAGAGIGLVNGLLIVKGDIPPFVATLAVMAIARGFTLVYTQGRPISGMGDNFVFWGTGKLGPIPVPVLILTVILILSYFILHHTRFGIHIFAIGGNEETARLAGINSSLGKISVYVISGFTAAVGGILLTARLWSAQPTAGVGLELDAIAATVLGGTSLMGGYGGTGGTVVGAFIMGILANGLNLLEISSYYQRVIKGLIFILAVMFDIYSKKKKKTT